MKDISKIISITFLTISITLLFYIYFRDEVINSGLKHNYYKNYYFFTCFAILVSTVSFFIKDKFKINFSIILFSSILALYTVETFFFFKSSHYQVLKADIKFDIRTKLDFFIDYKKKKRKEIYPVGFAIGNKNLYLTNTDGKMIVGDLESGDIINIEKVSSNFVSKPFIFNNSLFLIRNGSIVQYN